MSEASFDRVISDHLALSERNKRLERRMPLDRYREQADSPVQRESETNASANAEPEPWLDTEPSWDTTGERPLPEFDWGDE